jgi:competence protein ComEC
LLGVDRLAGVILTHPDLDHCAGLVEISVLLPIESLWATPGWDEPCYRRLIRRPGIRYRPVWAGNRWTVGRWALEVLHPPPGDRRHGNERSMVVRASLAGMSVLLTGDLGKPGELRLLAAHGRGLQSIVLKLGHHGSRGSTHSRFLRRVSPRIALVSSGRNNAYGHPAPEVLARLTRQGVAVWRTDLGGQIVVARGPRGEWSTTQPWAEMKRIEPWSHRGRSDRGLVQSSDEANRSNRWTDSGRQE